MDTNEPTAQAFPTEPAADPLAPGPDTTECPTPRRAEPVVEAERVAAVDVLRGFALLGILAMNVVTFAWPFSGYENPNLSGGPGLANRMAWLVGYLFFSGKMMSLFSMLFGAGLVLMSDRAEGRGAKIAGVYYRRIFWLFLIGMVHAYFIWSGDILVTYALCGSVLFFFRRMSPTRLIVLGIVLLLGSNLLFSMMGLSLGFMQGSAYLAQWETGPNPNQAILGMAEGWTEMQAQFNPNPEQFAEQIEHFRGGYWEVFRHRAFETFAFQSSFLPLFFSGIIGRMMLGMALLKLGVFSAKRTNRFYVVMALMAYGAGLSLSVIGSVDLWRSDFEPIRAMAFGSTIGLWGAVPVALGHAAVVMLVVKSGALPRLAARLSAVGRMALTNYLVQSIVGTLIFNGYGLGYFGTVGRPGLWVIVLAIWAVQLWYSPLWLARFRFGPAEWLWRSLTYLTPQPMRVKGE